MSTYDDQYANVRERYLQEPWGKLAEAAGLDPLHVESSARSAFQFCADRIEALESALKYARRFVKPAHVDTDYIDAVLRDEMTDGVQP